jgi:hypothetical protein
MPWLISSAVTLVEIRSRIKRRKRRRIKAALLAMKKRPLRLGMLLLAVLGMCLQLVTTRRRVKPGEPLLAVPGMRLQLGETRSPTMHSDLRTTTIPGMLQLQLVLRKQPMMDGAPQLIVPLLGTNKPNQLRRRIRLPKIRRTRTRLRVKATQISLLIKETTIMVAARHGVPRKSLPRILRAGISHKIPTMLPRPQTRILGVIHQAPMNLPQPQVMIHGGSPLSQLHGEI